MEDCIARSLFLPFNFCYFDYFVSLCQVLFQSFLSIWSECHKFHNGTPLFDQNIGLFPSLLRYHLVRFWHFVVSSHQNSFVCWPFCAQLRLCRYVSTPMKRENKDSRKKRQTFCYHFIFFSLYSSLQWSEWRSRKKKRKTKSHINMNNGNIQFTHPALAHRLCVCACT